MKTLRVQMIGVNESSLIDAFNDYHAVAEAADCAVNDVALPIWEERVRNGAPRGQRCYMPLDNTGRQWLAEDVV